MANNSNDKQAPAAPKKVRKFEAVSTINLGEGKIFAPGSTVLETDFKNPKDLRELLSAGRLRDGDAPVPPSQAEGVRELDRLISMAKEIGIVIQDGGEYAFGETKSQGLIAFRAAVSADELAKAIVSAATK
jgi:hypothetical protein